jgi:hypothetical protein
MRSRNDPFPADPKIEAFPTNLAVHGNLVAATQSLAMNAFFSRSASSKKFCRAASMPYAPTRRSTSPWSCPAKKSPRASRCWTTPPNWSPDCSTAAGCALWKRSGSGSRGIDAPTKPLTVRAGKGDKDRFHLSRHAPSFAPEPLCRGQDVASASPGGGACGALAAPCFDSEIPLCRQGMGLSVRLS